MTPGPLLASFRAPLLCAVSLPKRRSAQERSGAGDFSSWIASSPVVVGFAAPATDIRLFDVGRQAQNMMIAAHAEGVGSCPVTLHHPDRARAAVGLPAHWEMPMVITMGYPVADHPDSPLKRPRVALEELVRFNRYTA